jgi:hypothetical protein
MLGLHKSCGISLYEKAKGIDVVSAQFSTHVAAREVGAHDSWADVNRTKWLGRQLTTGIMPVVRRAAAQTPHVRVHGLDILEEKQ